jgi:hypothetical protein
MSSIAPTPASRWTPPKGRKSKDQIKRSPKSSSGWYLRSILVEGGLECIFITTSSFMEDAYTNPLIVTLSNSEPDPNCDEHILTIGLMGAYYMKVSLQNPGRLMNIRNGLVGEYQRKAFVRVIDEGDDDPAQRLAALKVIKSFLEDPKNNKYGTKVFIQEPGWDMTVTPLRKLDYYLEYKEIVKIIKDIYSNVDGNWGVENLDSALAYFTRGYIPAEAHSDIGIPMEYIGAFVTDPGLAENDLVPVDVDNAANECIAAAVENEMPFAAENVMDPVAADTVAADNANAQVVAGVAFVGEPPRAAVVGKEAVSSDAVGGIEVIDAVGEVVVEDGIAVYPASQDSVNKERVTKRLKRNRT